MRANALDIQQGMSWYPNAHEIARTLANRYDTTVYIVCGVIAALSPGCTWEKNIEYAERVLQYHSMGMDEHTVPKSIGTYGKRNMAKAFMIARGDDVLTTLGGDKVRAFFQCLFLPNSIMGIVCIDRHAVSIVAGVPLGEDYTKMVNTSKKYAAVSEAYASVAAMLDMAPMQLQAVTWVVWRRLTNGKVDSFM